MENIKYKTIPVNGDENYVVKTIEFDKMTEIYNLLKNNIDSIQKNIKDCKNKFNEDDIKKFNGILNILYPSDEIKELGLDINEKINESNNYDTLVKLNNIYNELSLILKKENIDGYSYKEKDLYENICFFSLDAGSVYLLCGLMSFLYSYSGMLSNKDYIMLFVAGLLSFIPGFICGNKKNKMNKNRINNSLELDNMISKIYEENVKTLDDYSNQKVLRKN